jgi:hypothetical protein
MVGEEVSMRAAGLLWVALALPGLVQAQTELIFMGIGADSPSPAFAHASLPGATGIDFDLFGAFDGAYPPEVSHEVVIWFEWGPSALGPWTASPDNVKTIPGAATTLFDTHVYHGPEDAPFVRLHFAAGGLMTVSGTFTHTSVVPEPGAGWLMLLGAAGLSGWRARRGLQPSTL